ncbi:MAG: cupin [Alphaproteobacteria bacterium]|nr:cupin [Alphaproteobacteria bacterium]MCW5744168.1 cupin [Alphaproteobacteria bacterium]
MTFRFAADPEVPNNPRLPLIIYRGALRLEPAGDPAAIFEEVFAANGWGSSWRNGIYPFRHFHIRAHEVLGIARGDARVEFGGAAGERLDIGAGDVAILPAGTGHRRLAQSADLLVVGAYPAAGGFDQKRAGEIDIASALADIAKVPDPSKDPVYGADGPLRALWGASGRVA